MWLGQQHVKRAIIVAAVQGHVLRVEFDGNVISDYDNYVKPYAHQFDVTVTSDDRYTADMYITLPIPQPDVLVRETHSELPIEFYKDQISRAKDIVKLVRFDVSQSKSLLTNILRQYQLTQWQYEMLISIAKSIAALAETHEVSPVHIAEAVLYIKSNKQE